MTVGAIVVTKNEENMIANCLETLSWCDERIVIDANSSDNTRQIARKSGAHVLKLQNPTFSESRNTGLEHSTADWLLYIDADERVTPALATEIRQAIHDRDYSAYSIPRKNVLYGKHMLHGGWERDDVVRLFHREDLKQWEGQVHEHAVVDGSTGKIREPIVHLTHRNMNDGLLKTITWTDIEADLYVQDKPEFRVDSKKMIVGFIRTLLKHLIIRRGYRDGVHGVVESMVQAINRFIVLEKIWERQQIPSLEEQYHRVEESIELQWKESGRKIAE